MFTLSTFKPSSGINQDYANGKIFDLCRTIVKFGDDRESQRRRKEGRRGCCVLYHVGFGDVVDAGYLDSHGNVHRWTCGWRSEKRKHTCPVPASQTRPRTHKRTLPESIGASHPHSIAHLFPSHPPSSHISNTPTAHRD